MVICGEGNLYFGLLAELCAHKLLLKAGNERAGSDGQRVVASLSAVKCNAVHKALEIDGCNVAVLYRSVLDGKGSCAVLSLLVDLLVDLCLGNGKVSLVNLHALVLAKLYFRLQSHLSGEDEGLALLDLGHIDLRGGSNLLLALLECLLICAGDQLVGCIFIEDCCAVHLLDHLAGHLALAEAGYADLVLVLLVRGLPCCL